MEARSTDDAPNSPKSQADYHAHAPKVVIQLLDLREIEALWGFTEDRVYRAVARGQLRAYGRPGRQKYYSEAELISVFGEPPHSPNGPSKRERIAKGG